MKNINGSALLCDSKFMFQKHTETALTRMLNPLVLQYFKEFLVNEVASSHIKIWTEWINPDSLLNYRADPNYRKTGPWYDWCMVGWGDESNQSDIDDIHNSATIHSVPAKIFCFYTLADGLERALVHSCHYQGSNNRNSSITEEWRLQYKKTSIKYTPVLTSIMVDVISGRVMVIQDNYDGMNWLAKKNQI